jgi:molecular chaperone GrpE
VAETPPDIPEIEELRRERDDLHDRLLRTAAELENWLKRAARESESAELRMRSMILGAILPIADNLERATAHAVEDDAVGVGVRLVQRQLAQVLERHGVTRFWPIGERFDPRRHEAIDRVETSEIAPGTVIEVRLAGYLVDSHLLRPAMVVVSKRPAEPVVH